MNDSTPPGQFTELVLRRRIDPFSFFGIDLPGNVWIVILVFVLLAGFFYIGWMYLKDSRGVGPGWAIFLGLLRAAVYVLLAWVFLLPGRQSVESSTSHSKVVVLFDTSLSLLHTVDDPPRPGVAFESMPTRQDKLLKEVLLDSKVNFFGRLEEKNPITAYRFARAVDEDFWYFDAGRNWTRAERIAFEEKMRDPLKAKEPLPEPKALQSEFLTEWLKPVPRVAGAKLTVPPEDWSEEDKARFKAVQDATQKLRDKGFFNGTNVSDSLQSVLTKEMNAMVQGIVVFTDGRSTEGSDLVYEEIERRAKAANIPIFVVGIGDDRPQVKIEIVDIRGPIQVQPEDHFKIVVEITGEGLPDADILPTLEIVNVVKDKSGNVKTDKADKEETLEIMLIEAEDKTNANKKRREISLGKEPIVLQPDKPAKFDRSSPPRVQVEYSIDAYTLAKATGKDLTAGEYANAKWEIGETKESELRARQHVPKDRMEIMAAKEHVGDPLDLRVIKRPVRALLLASGPTHDFQFLNNLLLREVEKKRAEESIHMQLPPNRTPAERRPGAVLGPPPERLLDRFPDRLDKPSDTAAEKYYDLAEYDVIVAFDPDWSQLSEDDMKNLQRWVDKGGGLIVVGGPINTVQLAKPGAKNDKVKPVLELYPVNLKDVRIDELDRTTDQPWALTFEGATPEMEFLKLDDNPDRKFLSDWTEFFYGVNELPKGDQLPPVQNGFFNYYPSESVKVGSQVVARFTDPRSKMKDGSQMPYIVLSDPNSGRRVIWIANGETYRLRKFSEAYHERFWTKLLRYAGANNQAKISKRISLNMSTKYKTNQFIQVDARIDGPGGIPLGKNAKVKIKLTVPTGVDQKEIPTDIEMKPKPGRDPLDEGKFQAKFQVRSPGEYGLELKVQDTGDSDTRKFTVVEANPELDDTRPDFDRMYHMASDADAVIARMAPAEGSKLKQALKRPKLNVSPGKEAQDDKARLFFTLQNAQMIPDCMVSRTDTRTTRGQIDDIWDKEARVWLPGMGWITIMPFPYGWLYVAVLLFSIEWLTRKLLRLA